MTGTRFDRSALPTRRVVIGSLVGALASGSVLGLVLGILSPVPDTQGKVDAASVGATQSASTAASTTAAAANPSPTKTTFKPVKTITRTAAAVPAGFIEHPENDRSMFLATLESMDAGNHDQVVVWVRRADLATGGQAQAWYTSQGQQPRNAAAIPRENAQSEGLVLANNAALWGVLVLGDQQNPNPRRLGFDEFVGLATAVLANNEHPGIWIKRGMGPTAGPVIYLAELSPN